MDFFQWGKFFFSRNALCFMKKAVSLQPILTINYYYLLFTQLSEVEISSGYGGLGVQAAKTPLLLNSLDKNNLQREQF